jgi:hypothetical protein
MIDDLWALFPTSKVTWLLVVAGVTTVAFALAAFACNAMKALKARSIAGPFLVIVVA